MAEFSPDRRFWWIQDELDDDCKAHPKVKKFSPHSFRKKAMKETWRMGIGADRAAIAFGCSVRTMMTHYVSLDETAISDDVLLAIAPVLDPRRQIPLASSDRRDETNLSPDGRHQMQQMRGRRDVQPK